MSKAKTDGPNEVAVAAGFVTPYEPENLFDQLDTADLATLDAPDGVLSDEEAKNQLIDVPIIIRSVSWNVGENGNFVSLDIVVGPNVGAFPKGSIVIVNDGSTGIYRQITSYCVSQGWLTVPDGDANGKAGASRWDTSYDLWELSDEVIRSGAGDVRYKETGEMILSLDLPRKFKCKNGLRPSKFKAKGEKGDPDYRPAGTTFYLA